MHIAAGAGFFSNFALWNEAGYFDNSSETKPLLHLWSLGIEEQFYIVWPLLLWVAWKKKFNLLTITILVLAISFYLNVKGIKKDAVATFYSPQTRFWELLCGSVLAWVTLYKKDSCSTFRTELDGYLASIVYRKKPTTDRNALSNAISFLGMAVLMYGFWKITKEVRFPGTWALVPVLGTVLIIAAGPTAWINRTILSNKIAVWFGLISFPLYLWHWPLLSFARILEGELPSKNIRIAMVLISIVLAWFTYKLVERPIRSRGHYTRTIILVLLMAVVASCGYVIDTENGIASRNVPRNRIEIPRTNYPCNDEEGNQICKLGNRDSKNRIIIYGDSHVDHIVKQLDSQLGRDFSIDVIFYGSCFMGNNIRFDDKPGLGGIPCATKINTLRSLSNSNPVAVITGQRWHGYGIITETQIQDAINDRLTAFEINPKNLIILGSTADVPLECELAKNRGQISSMNCPQSIESKIINKKFIDVTSRMNISSNVFFVYPYKYLCSNDDCKVINGNVSNYVDFHHLSNKGAEGVAHEIAGIIKESLIQ